MHPPRKMVEKFAYENPRLALCLLVAGAVHIGFAVWIVLSDL
jgi:hypothetical protein